MSFSKKLIIAGATAVVSTNASQCSISDYEIWFTNFMQGFQADPTNTNNDCFVASNTFTAKTHEFIESFSKFDVKDWLNPVYLFQEDLVDFTAVFSNCQT